MRELCEFRVSEEFANLLFAPGEGTRLGTSVRKVLIASNEPRFHRIGELQRRILRKPHGLFFSSWRFVRRYSKKEIDSAELFEMTITSTFEPAGEECGTVYDETSACDHVFEPASEMEVCGHRVPNPAVTCGVGARQVGPLFLDCRRIPRKADLARTIADEWIVSERLARLLERERITGTSLTEVKHRAHYEDDPYHFHVVPSGRELISRASDAGFPNGSPDFYIFINEPAQRALVERANRENVDRLERQDRKRKSTTRWFQLTASSKPVPTVPPTRYGIDPFDNDEKQEWVCPKGHVSGLNILSEVFVARKAWDESDFVLTKNRTGLRQGVLVPKPMMLISPKLLEVLRKLPARRFKVEVAHLV